MDRPEEIEIRGLLFGGIIVTLVLAISIIVFFVLYQRKLLGQQMNLQKLESDYQRQFLAASIDAQEKERARIARDLHDDVGSSLSTAKLFVNQLQLVPNEAEKQNLETVKALLSSTLQKVRSISHDLMPAELEKFGLVEALQNLVYLVSDAAHLPIDFQAQVPSDLPFSHELAIYRIVQELLTNTLKHAQASHLTIWLRQEGHRLVLTTHDNGRGFHWPAVQTSPGSGVGLRSIEARVSMLGGQMQIESSPENGTRVAIVITPYSA
jgi:signal transduction histidine kinase